MLFGDSLLFFVLSCGTDFFSVLAPAEETFFASFFFLERDEDFIGLPASLPFSTIDFSIIAFIITYTFILQDQCSTCEMRMHSRVCGANKFIL